MKLKNRQTGIVGELHYEPDKEYHFTVATEDPSDMAIYRTLAELNAKWEDYEPKEPRIKSDVVRKAVRAWFNILPPLKDRRILYDKGVLWVGVYKFDCGQYDLLDFWLESEEYYTLEELCGEEE